MLYLLLGMFASWGLALAVLGERMAGPRLRALPEDVRQVRIHRARRLGAVLAVLCVSAGVGYHVLKTYVAKHHRETAAANVRPGENEAVEFRAQ